MAEIKKALSDMKVDELVQDGAKSDEAKHNIQVAVRPVHTTHVGDVNKAVASFRKALKRAMKELSKTRQGEAAFDGMEVPLIVRQFLSEDETKWSEGTGVLTGPKLLENKKVFVDKSASHDFIIKLSHLSGFRGHAKWLEKHLHGLDGTTASSDYKPAVCNGVQKLLQETHKGFLSSVAFPKDKEGLKPIIFAPQHVRSKQTHYHIGVTPFGVTEMRVLLEGFYCVAGVPWDALKGTTLQDKTHYVLSDEGNIAFIENAVTASHGGFFVRHEEVAYTKMDNTYIQGSVGERAHEPQYTCFDTKQYAGSI